MRYVTVDFLAAAIQQFNRWLIAKIMVNSPSCCGYGLCVNIGRTAGWALRAFRTLRTFRTLRAFRTLRTYGTLWTGCKCCDCSGKRRGYNGRCSITFDKSNRIIYSGNVYGCHAVYPSLT